MFKLYYSKHGSDNFVTWDTCTFFTWSSFILLEKFKSPCCSNLKWLEQLRIRGYYLPWITRNALSYSVPTGIAAFFCFLNGFIVTVWICKRRREAIPGAYNQFTNPPMVDPMGNSYGYAMGPSQGGYVIATSAVAPNNGYVIATNAPQQFCVVQPQGIPVTGK